MPAGSEATRAGRLGAVTTSRNRPRKRRAQSANPRSDFVADLLRSCRALANTTDPLDAEFFASTVAALLDEPLSTPADTAARVGRLVRDVSAKRTPEALSLLHALAAILPAPAGEEARRAAVRLGLSGLPTPIWSGVVGNVQFVEAWAATDEFGDQDLILATFQHAGRPPHTFSLTADHNFRGLFKQAGVVLDPDVIRTRWLEVSGLPLLPITGDDLARRWRAGTRAYREYLDPPVDEDVPPLMPLLEARAVALPRPAEDDLEDVPDDISADERAEFAAAVETWAGREGLPGTADARAAALEALLDFRLNHADGDVLRWSPIVVEIGLLDWLPRKAVLADDATDILPDVLRAVVGYAGAQKRLPPELIAETYAAIAELEAEYREAMGDPASQGPAKAIVAQMQRDGIDLTDPVALATWIEAFNGRSQAEREAVVGPPTEARGARGRGR